MGRTACTEPQCLYKGALYLYLTVELYLYSPYGLYGLYRASVSVQVCTLPLPYSRAIPLLPTMGRTACTDPQCLYKDALYLYFTVELYLYSPYGPYGLYRASVPVQGCTLPLPYSRAVPLLPPMGRTACTEPQCLYKCALYLYLTVELYLYSPYGPYGLYRASVPVQGCTLPLPYSRAIPLLPTMGRTACTEPQCLYNGTLYHS